LRNVRSAPTPDRAAQDTAEDARTCLRGKRQKPEPRVVSAAGARTAVAVKRTTNRRITMATSVGR
jgi:hypothetical protein